jgi:hypothetical protein
MVWRILASTGNLFASFSPPPQILGDPESPQGTSGPFTLGYGTMWSNPGGNGQNVNLHLQAAGWPPGSYSARVFTWLDVGGVCYWEGIRDFSVLTVPEWCDPGHLRSGDFNADGRLDLICNADNGDHILAFSKGDGTFTSPGWLFKGWCDPQHLAYGDFNADAKMDLICNGEVGITTGRHVVAFANGDGTFSAPAGWWP